jgi:hypothetical protein
MCQIFFCFFMSINVQKSLRIGESRVDVIYTIYERKTKISRPLWKRPILNYSHLTYSFLLSRGFQNKQSLGIILKRVG